MLSLKICKIVVPNPLLITYIFPGNAEIPELSNPKMHDEMVGGGQYGEESSTIAKTLFPASQPSSYKNLSTVNMTRTATSYGSNQNHVSHDSAPHINLLWLKTSPPSTMNSSTGSQLSSNNVGRSPMPKFSTPKESQTSQGWPSGTTTESFYSNFLVEDFSAFGHIEHPVVASLSANVSIPGTVSLSAQLKPNVDSYFQNGENHGLSGNLGSGGSTGSQGTSYGFINNSRPGTSTISLTGVANATIFSNVAGTTDITLDNLLMNSTGDYASGRGREVDENKRTNQLPSSGKLRNIPESMDQKSRNKIFFL